VALNLKSIAKQRMPRSPGLSGLSSMLRLAARDQQAKGVKRMSSVSAWLNRATQAISPGQGMGLHGVVVTSEFAHSQWLQR